MQANFKGNEEKSLKSRIFCHNNTKFLHVIAGVLLYVVKKKLNTCIYLESDPADGRI